MANEQPDYTVIKKDNEFEIRQYTNFLTASVDTEGERYDAIGKGFRILFKYISGENIMSPRIISPITRITSSCYCRIMWATSTIPICP